MKDILIQSAKSSEVLELRHQVLRPHQNIGECAYGVDDLRETKHWKACNHKNEIIGIITLFPEQLDKNSTSQGYRIRGMAVSPQAQGLGVGALLLDHALKDRELSSEGYVWCNARNTAIGFYKKNGFKVFGEPFDIPGIGEHFIAKRLIKE